MVASHVDEPVSTPATSNRNRFHTRTQKKFELYLMVSKFLESDQNGRTSWLLPRQNQKNYRLNERQMALRHWLLAYISSSLLSAR